MSDSAEPTLLWRCQLEIERAWNSAMDRKIREMIHGDRQNGGRSEQMSFLAIVRRAAWESVHDIAAGMEVTPDFLVDASDHSSVLPLRAREEFVRRERERRGARGMAAIDEDVAMASFDAPRSLRRAASRSRPFQPVTATYRELVERSSLSDAEKQVWLDLA